MPDTFTTHSGGCSAECQSGDGTALNVNAGWSDLAIIMDSATTNSVLTLSLSPDDAYRLGLWLVEHSLQVHAQGRAA